MLSQIATPEKKSELISDFIQAQGRGLPWGKKPCFTTGDDNAQETLDAPLVTCPCCGFRNMDTSEFKRTYIEVDVSDLTKLKLREGDNDDADDANDTKNDDDKCVLSGPRSRRTQGYHRRLMDREPLVIPYNDEGDTKEVELWRLRSVWPAKKPDELKADKDTLPDYMFDEFGEPVYFHLHPEFVDEKVVPGEPKKTYTAMICSNCKACLDDKKTPYQSLAAGIDFGDPYRIGLEPLTERERHMVSKLRHFLLVIKIESNTADGRVIERGQSKIKGCGIYFNHDSPLAVSNLLSSDAINEKVTLHFVGPEGEYDALAAKVIGSANVEGRPWVIYQWLKVLQEVNCHYRYDDELPDFDEVKARIKAANKSLIENAEHINDESVLRETEIAKDDARHIRTYGQKYTCDTEKEVKTSGSDFPLRCSFITPNTSTTANREYIECAAETLGVDDSTQKQWMSRREDTALNEYDNGDQLLAKGNPDVFLFGTAYSNNSPTLSKYQREHLLMQYTTSAGSNRQLLFQMYDSDRRHGVISSMHAKVSKDPREFEKFANEFMSDEFQAKFKAALKNPEGKEAKYVLNKITPIMSFAGRKSAYGATERNQSAGEILAMLRRFGSASAFDTFGIDDINHPNSIRYALRSFNNHDFPAVVSSASQVEMKSGIKLKKDESSISIPYTYTERMELMNNNPVGAAMAYKNMTHHIMCILMGTKPSKHSGDNNRTTQTKFTSPEQIGIIGSPGPFFGKNETTHSGSLHHHSVHWSGLPPELLESVADIPELCYIAARVLDSQCSASLDRNIHVQSLVKETIGTVKGQIETQKIRAAANAKSSTPRDTSAKDTSVKDTLDVREDTLDINESNLKDINTNGSDDNDSDVQMEDVSQPASEHQTQDTPTLANPVQDTSNASNETESTDKGSDMVSLHASPSKGKSSIMCLKLLLLQLLLTFILYSE